MQHFIVLPVVLPLLVGAVLMVLAQTKQRLIQVISVITTLAVLPIAIYLVGLAQTDAIHIYALGNWQAPLGIVFLLDRLSAALVLLTSVLAVFVVLYSLRGADTKGVYFHALLQFQLAGIYGAFLTGDLFNLFVFFEILLIASYALLLHGRSQQQIQAAMHYVILNLIGSSLFLLAAAIFYGVAGTLNIADLARAVAEFQGDKAHLLRAAGLLLFVVFGLKAAVLPLYFWLPKTYASANPAVAALFAIMTKVGLYALLRFSSLVYGDLAGISKGLGLNLLWVLGLLTLCLGAWGAFAASRLQSLTAYLVLVSVGTIMAGIALATPTTLAATLFYLVQSTLVSASLFLLTGLLLNQRGKAADRLVRAHLLPQKISLGLMYFVAAIAIAGLPPLSGFLGKAWLLSQVEFNQAVWLWPALLLSSLLIIVSLARAGSLIFWRSNLPAKTAPAPLDKWAQLITCLLISTSIWLVIFAQPLADYMQATAQQLFNPAAYISILTKGDL